MGREESLPAGGCLRLGEAWSMVLNRRKIDCREMRLCCTDMFLARGRSECAIELLLVDAPGRSDLEESDGVLVAVDAVVMARRDAWCSKEGEAQCLLRRVVVAGSLAKTRPWNI